MTRHVRITTGKAGKTPRGTVHIDAAELPNPYEEKWLRPRDGRDKHVQAWLMKQPGVGERLAGYLDQVESKQPATVSVTCSAGRHRSVAVGEWLTQQLRAQGWDVQLTHRELKAKPATSPAPAGDMANVTVVTGPPAAGKTTHVREHAQDGDVIIDFDLIANTLAGKEEDNHEHAAHVQTAAKAARQAALDAAIKTSARVWLIHAMPSDTQRADYEKRGAEIVTIDPGKDVVMQRIKTERPERMAKAAGQWYSNQGKPASKAKRTTERGYGWKHQKQRERLLRAHKDGAPCSHCGKPMYRDPARNFDGAPLEAQHADALANHADKQRAPLASELMHRFCNRSLGDGTREVTPPGARPASGGFNWQTLG